MKIKNVFCLLLMMVLMALPLFVFPQGVLANQNQNINQSYSMNRNPLKEYTQVQELRCYYDKNHTKRCYHTK